MLVARSTSAGVVCLGGEFDEATRVALNDVGGAYDDALAVRPEVVAASSSEEWPSHQLQPIP